MLTRHSTLSGLIILALASPALQAGAPSKGNTVAVNPAAKTADSPWRVRSGVMWRKTGALKVSPDSFGSFTAGLPDFTSNIGPAGENSDRTYADGFVNISAATAVTGSTTFWGYDNASQVVGDSITFNSAPITTLTSAGDLSDNDKSAEVPYIEVAYLVPINDRLEAGVSLQLAFNGLHAGASSTLNEASVIASDTYNVSPGFIFPSAGYAGVFPGPGPLIGNQPDSRSLDSTPISSHTYRFDADTDVYSLAIGGELLWEPKDRLLIGFSSGAVINYVRWDAQWSAPVFSGSSSTQTEFSNDGDTFLFGLYTKGSLGYQINPNWSADSFFRYDWTESLEEKVTSTGFDVNLSGWSGGLGLTYRF